MIQIVGAVRRAFIFPASLPEAFAFYGDFARTLNFLEHISTVQAAPPNRFRLQYHTLELGLYPVTIVCDIQVELDRQEKILRILPDPASIPIRSQMGMYQISAQGIYRSTSRFFAETPASTRVDYDLRMQAELPIPLALRLVPVSILDGVASRITRRRMGEIVQGFIERSIASFQAQSLEN